MKNQTKFIPAEQMFKTFGYFKEYICEGKLIATEKCEKPKDELFGSQSRTRHVAEEKIRFGKKSILKGQVYHTVINILCGRSKIKFSTKQQTR